MANRIICKEANSALMGLMAALLGGLLLLVASLNSCI